MGYATRTAMGLLGLLATTGCLVDWRDQVDPKLVAAPPEQTSVQGVPTALRFGDVEAILTARARYRIRAYALIVDASMRDAWSDVARLDVAFGWGPVATTPVLRGLNFHLKRRYVSVRWGTQLPLGPRQVMNHLSNHHLIAADTAVAEALAKVRPGDLVTLEGDLVDLQVRGQTMRTSLSRTDVGNGACEVLFVEHIERQPPPRPSTVAQLLGQTF